MLKRILVSAAVSAGLLLSAYAAARWLVNTAPAPAKVAKVRPPLVVQAMRAERQDRVEPIVGYGTVRADRSAWIAAEVPGTVLTLAEGLRVGAEFRADDLLLEIEPREYARHVERAAAMLAAEEAALTQIAIQESNTRELLSIASTELEIADRERLRVLDLFERNVAQQRELDAARSAFEAARRTVRSLENELAMIPQRRAGQAATRDMREAELALARLNLERCTVRAPFDGVVSAVRVEIGERVAVGTGLVELVDPRVLETPIELPVSLRSQIRIGAPCELRLESDPAVAWSGRIERLSPVAAEATRSFTAYALVRQEDAAPALLPGMFVRATVEGPVLHEVIAVPRGCVRDDAVYVLDENVARRREVEVERTFVDEAIVSGLKDGELVITTNLDVLFDGAPVRLSGVEGPPLAAGAGEAAGATP